LPNLTDGRFCPEQEEQEKQENQRYEKYDRDPAIKRRYGRAWKRI
jgi:5-methylcytosine-specific restriction protein A